MAKPKESMEQIELGTFEIKADNSDRDNVEVRLSDEKSGSVATLRKKGLRGDFPRGGTGTLIWRPDAVPEAPTVVVEVPAEEVSGITSRAKVVKDASSAGKDNPE